MVAIPTREARGVLSSSRQVSLEGWWGARGHGTYADGHAWGGASERDEFEFGMMFSGGPRPIFRGHYRFLHEIFARPTGFPVEESLQGRAMRSSCGCCPAGNFLGLDGRA